MADYEGGTTLKNARNQPVYPRTKAEYVEGLDDSLIHITSEIRRLEGLIQSGTPMPPSPDYPNTNIPAGFIPLSVTKLPEVGEIGVVYRVPSENTSSLNIYDEYYWVPNQDGVGGSYEKIGHRDPGGDEWGSEDNDSGYEWID